MTKNIGTWPTPERQNNILEAIEFIDNVAEPFEEIKDISEIFIDFRSRICKKLDSSIRSDIGCLCKYIGENPDLCKEPKIEECLSRLCKTYKLYKLLCCRR